MTASARSYAAGSWLSLDVTDVVRTAGGTSFALTGTGATYAGFSSQESDRPPRLTVVTTPSGGPAPRGAASGTPTTTRDDDGTEAAVVHGWGAPLAGDDSTDRST